MSGHASAQPIGLLDIEAYQRLFLVDLTAWQVDMICRLDDAVRNIWAGGAGSAADREVSITDSRGVRGLLSGIRDRMRAKG